MNKYIVVTTLCNKENIANEIVEKKIKVSSDRVSYIIEQAQQVLLNYSP